ncbi:MAG: hypothetical protein JJE09_16005 [Bacteroidia bacterium]|nr:hypothetical protein [Bacteroidia bacterium]
MAPVAFFVVLNFVSFQVNTITESQQAKDKLVVSFISIGSGIDYKAHERLQLFIEEFQQENHVQLRVSIKNWGREGETDFTFDLGKLSKKQCKAFVERIEAMFAKNDRVKISHSDPD